VEMADEVGTKSWWKGAITDLVRDLARWYRPYVTPGKALRRMVQKGLAECAALFCCEGVEGYPVQFGPAPLRQGAVDVVWVHEGSPVVAFQMEGTLRRRAINALFAISVPLRFWVCDGHEKEALLFSLCDPHRRINVIGLGW